MNSSMGGWVSILRYLLKKQPGPGRADLFIDPFTFYVWLLINDFIIVIRDECYVNKHTNYLRANFH